MEQYLFSDRCKKIDDLHFSYTNCSPKPPHHREKNKTIVKKENGILNQAIYTSDF